ncbi:MAG: DNA repair protein RadA [Steroidobacteraceae bacterium]|jgi:DNA repair protein RadA/Sms|nr:DNA repair protein RadA [Steroidobacteraceae bacterium]
MARPAVAYLCNVCAAETLKWQGQCPQCGEWNSLEQRLMPRAGTAARPAVTTGKGGGVAPSRLEAAGTDARFSTGLAELDRVLGGGVVPGSVSLIGGDPGIGKSTLLLQVAASAAPGRPMLYATGEESLGQVSMRARRLGLESASLSVLAQTDLEVILEAAQAAKAALLIVDSIQTVQFAGLGASAGAVTQLKECTAQLVRFAKTTGIAVVIIGHVTKEGAIAGPRVLEHLVDAVLYFESEAGSRFRIVRAVKNRFGAVNELAFFVMGEEGLKEVRNPSAIFLARAAEPAPGSIVMVARDSGRPLLIELQALVDRMRFGAPRRVAQGLDANRLAMLLAILSRHAGVSLQEHDVFANVVGGLALGETATDLPLVLALTSSLRDRPLPQTLVAFGEVGLTGEVRPVAYGEERLREAAKQGFKAAVVPQGNVPRKAIEGLAVRGVSRVAEAIAAADAS